ncbi:LysR family transcriptional regulator [Reinekea sp.]|jgi:DNA-binding transcriptional LysR family regulator|uniref:LysR family transcriptional regulator n=1 Tax=Reinekea sp. TaxID=1970455 RepID=UPI0039899955
MNRFNWQWWQYFLALAEHGSLSKAAEILLVSQPTLSRQLVAMESKLGQALFDRSTQGLSLTQFGAGFLEQAQEMEATAQRLQRFAQGQENRLVGRLRLSANEMVAQYYLPKILPKFMDQYPEVAVEIEVSNQASNLDKRDADIAIRMFPPTQLDIKARHLFNIPLGFFAHKEYLDTVGRPTTEAELFSCRILGFDRDEQFIKGARSKGWNISKEDFFVRSDFLPMHLEIARNKGGVVVTHKALCFNAGLEELCFDVQLPSLPIYLACHRDVQHNQKIRVMMEFLAEYLEASTQMI